jgi:hypothetical protein
MGSIVPGTLGGATATPWRSTIPARRAGAAQTAPGALEGDLEGRTFATWELWAA